MAKIFIVSSRYGCDMDAPKVFKNRTDAEDMILNDILNSLMDQHSDEMEEDGVDTDNNDDVFEWADAHDLCSSYHNLGFPDTYTGGVDWIEYMITEVDLED